MHQFTALYTLAYRRQDVRFGCQECGHARLEPIEALVAHFGPLFPLGKLADHSYCRKCGGVAMRAAPG